MNAILSVLVACAAQTNPVASALGYDTIPLPDGPYASRQVMTSRTKPGPRSRPIPVRTIALVIHDVRREGAEVIFGTRFCAVRQDPIGRVRTVLDSAFVNALPSWQSRAEIEGIGPWRVRIAEHVAVVGAELEDPASDPLPEEADDPRVTDPDGDDHPGVTVRVEGLVSGEIYLVQRMIRGLEGDLARDGRMIGNVRGTNEQQTLGASNLILRAFTPTFVADPAPDRNTFSWVPIASHEGCADIVAAEDRIFGRLE
jgi:hypothetical protein